MRDIKSRLDRLEALHLKQGKPLFVFANDRDDLEQKLSAALAQHPDRPLWGLRWLGTAEVKP